MRNILWRTVRRVCVCVIARGGSSSPGLYTSRTGAADALCSGPTHPARLVSLEVSGKKKRELLWEQSNHKAVLPLLFVLKLHRFHPNSFSESRVSRRPVNSPERRKTFVLCFVFSLAPLLRGRGLKHTVHFVMSQNVENIPLQSAVGATHWDCLVFVLFQKFPKR